MARTVLTPEKKMLVWINWKGMSDSLAKLEQLTLELMRHPEVTNEQLRAAHDMYTKNHAAVMAVKGDLIQLGVIGK